MTEAMSESNWKMDLEKRAGLRRSLEPSSSEHSPNFGGDGQAQGKIQAEPKYSQQREEAQNQNHQAEQVDIFRRIRPLQADPAVGTVRKDKSKRADAGKADRLAEVPPKDRC